jgi:hypothetical protein
VTARRFFLLVVDGRSQKSVGMTLVELAALMRRLGAWQAMNFDGGGSTTMIIDGAIVNAPSDATGEREVGNALLVDQAPVRMGGQKDRRTGGQARLTHNSLMAQYWRLTAHSAVQPLSVSFRLRAMSELCS